MREVRQVTEQSFGDREFLTEMLAPEDRGRTDNKVLQVEESADLELGG